MTANQDNFDLDFDFCIPRKFRHGEKTLSSVSGRLTIPTVCVVWDVATSYLCDVGKLHHFPGLPIFHP